MRTARTLEASAFLLVWATTQLGCGRVGYEPLADPPPPSNASLEVVAGSSLDVSSSPQDSRKSHTCARFVDGTVRCWGPDVNGETAAGTTASLYPTPTIMAGLNGAAQIAIGQFHTCVRLVDRTV